MKKTFLKFFIFALCAFVVISNVKAIDINEFVGEMIEEVTEEELVLDTACGDYRADHSTRYKWIFEEMLDARVKALNVNNRVDVLWCNRTSCLVNFVRYNEEDYSYYAKKETIPVKYVGFIIDDIVDANVGQTVTPNYRFLDETFHEKQVTLNRVDVDWRYRDYVEITHGDQIKVLKSGIIPCQISFEYNGETYWKDYYILANFNTLLDNAINDLSNGFLSNRARYSYYVNEIDVAEDNFIYDLVGASYIDTTKVSNTTCNTEECNEDIVMNFNFKFYINDREYVVKKDNVNVTVFGIKINEYNYPALDLEMGETHETDYDLWSPTATWATTNPNVATVDNNGVITAVGEGACVISASVENDQWESMIVRVVPTSTFKATLTATLNNLLNDKLHGRNTIEAKAVSTLSEGFLKEYISDVIYDLFDVETTNENINLIVDFSEDLTKAYVSLGYRYYDLELPNGQTDTVSYCKTYEDDEYGFDCNPEPVELTLVYEDQTAGYNSSLLERAEELLSGINFEKKHYSYINRSLPEIMNALESNGSVFRVITRYSDFNDEIANDEGYEFVFIPRMGGLTVTGGDGYIAKNGIAYAAAKDFVGITEAVGIPNNPTTEEAKVEAVKKVVTDRVNTNKYKVTVEKIPEEYMEGDTTADCYSIYIVDKNNEEKYIYLYVELVPNYTDGGGEVPVEEGLRVDAISNKEYTGSAITPKPNVYYNGTKLTINKDYKLTYSNNTKVGVAKVTVTSLNTKKYKFAATSVNFNIVAKEITPENMTLANHVFYTGKPLVINPVIKVGSKTLVKNTDYELTFDNLDGKIGQNVTVHVTGKGNYTGEFGKDVLIVGKVVTPKASISKAGENKLKVIVDEQEHATEFYVYRSTSKTKNYKKIATITEGFEYVDTGLTYGTTYYYKVTAHNQYGTSSYSNIVSGKPVPEKVESLKVDSVASTSVKLSYDKVNTTGYEVYMGTSTKKMKNAATISKSDTLTYTKTKLKANTTYYFKVRAYKKVGKKKIYGSFSEIVKVRTAPAVPSVTVSTRDYDSLSITLKSTSGATLYEVQKSLDNVEFTTLESLPKSGVLVDSELNLGQTYYYRVRTCNSESNCSAWTSVLSKKVALRTPSGLKKSVGARNVLVSYSSINGADGYELYRSTSKTKGFKLIATLDSETLSYNDKKLSEYKTYYYKVRAFRNVGDTKVYSSYSSVLTTKTRRMNKTEKAALAKAKSYVKSTYGYSYSTLFEKLKTNNYSDAVCEFAIDYSGVNYKTEAVEAAKRLASEKEYHAYEMLIALHDLGFSDEDGEYGALNAGISYLPEEE